MYVHVTRTPGRGIADYRAVLDALGTEPIAGRHSHYYGEVDGSLLIVDVWESRAAADHFAAERLFPAFEASGRRPSPDALILAFEAAGDASLAAGVSNV